MGDERRRVRASIELAVAVPDDFTADDVDALLEACRAAVAGEVERILLTAIVEVWYPMDRD